MKLSEVERPPRLLIVGAGGTRKTAFIGTLAAMLPTVVVTSDPAGLETIRSNFPEVAENLEVELLESWGEAWNVYERLAGYARDKKFKALALDDYGASQALTISKILSSPRGKDEERMRGDDLAKRVMQQRIAGFRKLQGQPQWGELGTASGSFLEFVLALPFGVEVVTVREDIRAHPRDGEASVYPALMGALRDDVDAYFQVVANTFLDRDGDGRTLFVMTTRPHPRMANKNRYAVGRTWVDPTFERVFRNLRHTERKEDEESALERRIGAGRFKE